MKDQNTNSKRNKEGDVSKGLPEAAPEAGNAYEEDEMSVKEHPAKENPDEHGEVPRTRDDSQDDKVDPYKQG
ncbi:hypothetical protein AAH446_05910 [Erwinia sp. P6884]|uniref:hypothetical protein n=1 Tax=Erwinia sp. P6884 TaxID=3141450 RepID=UPI00319A3DAD